MNPSNMQCSSGFSAGGGAAAPTAPPGYATASSIVIQWSVDFHQIWWDNWHGQRCAQVCVACRTQFNYLLRPWTVRTQTLREQGLGAKAISPSYPEKRWKLSTVKKVCSWIDRTGSAVLRKPGSRRPATASLYAVCHCKTIWIANKFAKFHAKGLNKVKILQKVLGGLLFWKHPE